MRGGVCIRVFRRNPAIKNLVRDNRISRIKFNRSFFQLASALINEKLDDEFSNAAATATRSTLFDGIISLRKRLQTGPRISSTTESFDVFHCFFSKYVGNIYYNCHSSC